HLTLARSSSLAEILAERRVTDHDTPQAHPRQHEPPAAFAGEHQSPQPQIDHREDQLRAQFLVAHPPPAAEPTDLQYADEHGTAPSCEAQVFCHAERGIARPSTRRTALPFGNEGSCPLARTLSMRPSS